MAATTYVIRQFGIVSVAKFFAVLGLIWGFVMGLFVAAGFSGMGYYMMGSHGLGIIGGLAALVFMTILGAVFGFVGGAIAAIVYNVVLGASGGVEMDLETKA